MLRACELGLSFTELDQITMGMVYDMAVEKQNDREEYPTLATQEDFDRF